MKFYVSLKCFFCIPALFGVFFFLNTKKKANADPRTTTTTTDTTIGTTLDFFLEPADLLAHNSSAQIRSGFPSLL